MLTYSFFCYCIYHRQFGKCAHALPCGFWDEINVQFFYFLSPLTKEQTSSWSKQSAKFGCNWPSDSGQWFLSGQYIFHHRYFAINSAWRLAWLIIWKTRGPQALTVTSVPETGQISCPKKGPILFLIIKFEARSLISLLIIPKLVYLIPMKD